MHGLLATFLSSVSLNTIRNDTTRFTGLDRRVDLESPHPLVGLLLAKICVIGKHVDWVLRFLGGVKAWIKGGNGGTHDNNGT